MIIIEVCIRDDSIFLLIVIYYKLMIEIESKTFAVCAADVQRKKEEEEPFYIHKIYNIINYYFSVQYIVILNIHSDRNPRI